MSHIPDYQPPDPNDLLHQYRQNRRRMLWVLTFMALIMAALMLASLLTGPFNLFEYSDNPQKAAVVLWRIRLPRTLAALAAGVGLGLSGALIQILMKNPLAAPSTLGISHGAAFGAAFAMVILKLSPKAIIGVTGFAFVGAILATLFIMGLSVLKRLPPQAMVLAGVAFSSLFMAGTILIQFMASEIELASVVFWTFGDVNRATLPQTAAIGACCLLALLFFLRHHWNIKTLSAGEDSAQSLGVHVIRLRLLGMLLAAMTAAVVTAFCGVIAFLGLLAPHIARFFARRNQTFVIPMACLCGANLLLGADIVIRLSMATRLPVGIITSFMGAPVFLILLMRKNDYA